MYTDLINRLKKKHQHLKKWAKRTHVSCYRIYAKDLPDHPLIVDWYDGDAVVWITPRTIDDTPEKETAYQTHVTHAVCQALQLTEETLHVKTRKKQKGLSNQYTKLASTQGKKWVTENGLHFEVNLTDYLDTGLFLDHRPMRACVKEWSKDKRVLNLFAYTGTFTCYAIAGGAIATTTVDLNTQYLEWAKRNVMLNFKTLRSSDRFIKENCMDFLKHEHSKNRYDLIICDPPTFSNSKSVRHGTFAINDDYPELITTCAKLLAPNGMLLFSTNSKSFKLDPEKLPKKLLIKNVTPQSIPEDFKTCANHQCWLIVNPT